ncbi:MAG TPA: acyloxyacyl hydrolase [Crenotrichaceae bacterium]|nr:acyloxyacyl hydrolase [Crenotrichaceae bacterium]
MSAKFTFIVVCFYSLTSLISIAHADKASATEHFGYGQIYSGLQGGWGKAFSLGSIAGDGDGRKAEYVAILPQLGIGLSNVVGENSWFKGNLDAVFQGEFLAAYEPDSGYSAGLSLLLRYNFLYSDEWVPYLEFGGGVGVLDFDLRDQEDGLIFYPQAGLGVHYFFHDNMSVDLGWRFHHMSNANTTLPNNSINASLLLFGFSWYFD